jgi:hypothetical protein
VFGRIVVRDWAAEERETGSVVHGSVVKDPSGFVDVLGRIVVRDWAADEGEICSVVPGIVVKEPSGSVEVCGGMVVNDSDPLDEIDGLPVGELRGKVSVVPGIVVGDSFGSVEVVGRKVLSEKLPVRIPVTELELLNGGVFVPDATLFDELDPLKGLVFVPDTTLAEEPGLEELVPTKGVVFVPETILPEEAALDELVPLTEFVFVPNTEPLGEVGVEAETELELAIVGILEKEVDERTGEVSCLICCQHDQSEPLSERSDPPRPR